MFDFDYNNYDDHEVRILFYDWTKSYSKDEFVSWPKNLKTIENIFYWRTVYLYF